MSTTIVLFKIELKIDYFKGINIVIGTPGRINSLLQQFPLFKISMQTLEVLVLDEADRLLNLGFESELMSILRY